MTAVRKPLDPATVREITTRLNDAATVATVLMTQIDEGDISAEMQRRFSEVSLKTREGLDQARQLSNALQAFQQQLTWEKARIDCVLEQLEKRQEALRERVRDVVRDNPGVVFRDSTNTKIYLRANRPALKMTIEGAKKSVSHILPEDSGIPDHFTKFVTFRVADTDAIRTALEAGETLHFAWLEQGQALCGL